MKKSVLTGLGMLLVVLLQAQSFRKGDAVEINRNLTDQGEVAWTAGKVEEVNRDQQQYSVRTKDRLLFRIPFVKEASWMRRPAEPLTSAMRTKDEVAGCTASVELLKQKLQEEFQTDFSEYDSVTITYNNIEALPEYNNTDEQFGKPGSTVYPYNVDFTVRLVSYNLDGTQRKINWQFKRKYLLHQDLRGRCSLTVAEKEDNLISHI